MEIQLQETKSFQRNEIREKWMADPVVTRYFDTFLESDKHSAEMPAFSYFYEIFYDKKLIGDVKVFGYREDLRKRMAQILIVLGEMRGKGIGTLVIRLLLSKLRNKFITVYCYVNRYNIASIKMLQKNGFLIKNLKKNEVILYKTLL